MKLLNTNLVDIGINYFASLQIKGILENINLIKVVIQNSIPSAVVGGIFLPAAASLIVTGLRALRKVADDERRQTVIGMSLLLGIALPKALSGLTGGASVFFGNNIMVGVFSAIILNALFVALPDLVAKHRAPASVDVPAADPADGTGAAAYDER